MKSTALALAAALAAPALFAQAPLSPQTLADYQLNQSAREIITTTYTAKGTPKRYDVAQIKRNTPPKKYIFDAQGRLAEEQTLDPAIPDMSSDKITYAYNPQNQIISVTQTEPDQISRYQAQYQPDGRLSQYQYAQNPPYTAQYPPKDNPDSPFYSAIFSAQTDKNQSLTLTQTFNTKNQLAKTISEGPAANDRRITTYEYNQNNQPIDIRTYDYRDKPISQTTLIYNDKGLLAEVIRSSPDGGISTQLKYQYLYDQKGNWIECAEIEKGFVYVVTRRQIKY